MAQGDQQLILTCKKYSTTWKSHCSISRLNCGYSWHNQLPTTPWKNWKFYQQCSFGWINESLPTSFSTTNYDHGYILSPLPIQRSVNNKIRPMKYLYSDEKAGNWAIFQLHNFYSWLMTCLKNYLHLYGLDLLYDAHSAWEMHNSHLWTGLIKHYHEETLIHEISLSLQHLQHSEPLLGKGSAFFIVSTDNQLTLTLFCTQLHKLMGPVRHWQFISDSSIHPLLPLIPLYPPSLLNSWNNAYTSFYI